MARWLRRPEPRENGNGKNEKAERRQGSRGRKGKKGKKGKTDVDTHEDQLESQRPAVADERGTRAALA